MARLCTLFSGSSGNCTYIKDGDCGLLIDAGASFKNINDALLKAGGSTESLCGVFITHEHTDHVKGLKTLLKKTGIPLYASAKTLSALEKADMIPENTAVFEAASATAAGDFYIERFATSHDCEGSSGYGVTLKDGRKITVCTDLGIVTDSVRAALSGSSAVVFESNHDIEMLRRGPYPPALKMRILSEKGHLSNAACAAELPALLQNGTSRFILAHLSLHNNLPALAANCANSALAAAGAVKNSDYILVTAKPCGNPVISL